MLWRSCWDRLSPAQCLGWGASSGNQQGRTSDISQVNGEHVFGVCLRQAAGWKESSTKEQWLLLALMSQERSALTPLLQPSP